MVLKINHTIFEFETEVLGKIVIKNYSMYASKIFYEGLNTIDTLSSEQIIRRLICVTGYKKDELTGTIDKNNLTEKDTLKITSAELERFSEKFIEKNDWLFEDFIPSGKKTYKKKKDEEIPVISHGKKVISKSKNETYIDYLSRVFKEYEKRRINKLKEIADSFRPVFSSFYSLKNDLNENIFNNLAVSGSLGSAIANIQQELIKQPEPIKPIELITSLKPHEEALIETNNKIRNIDKFLNNFSPLITETASLIKSMNDTIVGMMASISRSARSSKIFNTVMITIGIVTLIATLFISFIDYRSNKENANQNQILLEKISESISAINQLNEKYFKESNEINNALKNAIDINHSKINEIYGNIGSTPANKKIINETDSKSKIMRRVNDP